MGRIGNIVCKQKAAIAMDINKLRNNPYLQGYMDAFALHPVGERDDPWEDVRIAYEEVGCALWDALLDLTPVLEQQTEAD